MLLRRLNLDSAFIMVLSSRVSPTRTILFSSLETVLPSKASWMLRLMLPVLSGCPFVRTSVLRCPSHLRVSMLRSSSLRTSPFRTAISLFWLKSRHTDILGCLLASSTASMISRTLYRSSSKISRSLGHRTFENSPESATVTCFSPP